MINEATKVSKEPGPVHSDEDVLSKYDRLTSRVFDTTTVDETVAVVQELEQVDDVTLPEDSQRSCVGERPMPRR